MNEVELTDFDYFINERKEEIEARLTLEEYKEMVEEMIPDPEDEFSGTVEMCYSNEQMGYGGLLNTSYAEAVDIFTADEDLYKPNAEDEQKWNEYQEWANDYYYDEEEVAEEILKKYGYEFDGNEPWKGLCSSYKKRYNKVG